VKNKIFVQFQSILFESRILFEKVEPFHQNKQSQTLFDKNWTILVTTLAEFTKLF